VQQVLADFGQERITQASVGVDLEAAKAFAFLRRGAHTAGDPNRWSSYGCG